MRGVVGACADATGFAFFFDAIIQIAHHRTAALLFLMRHRIDHGDRVHGDVSVRTVFGALSTTDAMVFDEDRQSAFAMDRVHRTSGKTFRISATSTGSGDEVVVVAESVANQPCDAKVRLRAGLNAFIAACAAIEIDRQHVLGLKKFLIEILA